MASEPDEISLAELAAMRSHRNGQTGSRTRARDLGVGGGSLPCGAATTLAYEGYTDGVERVPVVPGDVHPGSGGLLSRLLGRLLVLTPVRGCLGHRRDRVRGRRTRRGRALDA